MTGGGKDVCQWLAHIKLSRIIIVTSVVLFIVPLFTHYYLSKVRCDLQIYCAICIERRTWRLKRFSCVFRFQVESDAPDRDVYRTFSTLEAFEDFTSMKASQLKMRIEEMLRIKISVSNELRDLGAKRQRLQSEVNSLTQKIDELKQELLHQQTDLDRLKISVEQAQVAQREAVERNTPELAPPKRILIDAIPVALPSTDPRSCKMYNCFDHSRCALTSGFPVYLYDPDQFSVVNAGWDVDGFLKTTIKQTLGTCCKYLK